MNRRDFLIGVPALSLGLQREIKQRNRSICPVVIAACVGESGRRVWSHLLHYRSTERMLPMVVEDERAILEISRFSGLRELLIVSALDDFILSYGLGHLENEDRTKGPRLVGYFVYPYGSDEHDTALANTNLRYARKILHRVRVTNLPDYAPGEQRPRWPLKWLSHDMTDAEKQIVWEILRNEQQTITKHKQ